MTTESGIRLEFAQFGHFTSFDIIRSMVSMVGVADEDLPTPIATGLKTMYYVDIAVVRGTTYFYKVRVWRGELSFVSDQLEAIADKDDYWANVTSLLHFNGANNSASFVDERAFTWSVLGNAKISTAAAKFGGSSGYFDGSGDYITGPSSVVQFGLGDFTVEAFVNIESHQPGASADPTILGYGTGPNAGLVFMLSKSNGAPGFWDGASFFGTGVAIPVGTWAHVAYVRKNKVLWCFINGVRYSLSSNYNKNVNANSVVRVGGAYYGGNESYFKGYIDELRVTSGVARYSENFTPPTRPFLAY